MMEVAIGFLMTYIGTPCLYYGTEVGMTGDNDINCRRGFPWDRQKWNHTLLKQAQRWITIRKEQSSLSQGAVVDVYADEDTYVFARLTESEQALVAVNRGQNQRTQIEVDLPGQFKQWQRVQGDGVLTSNGEILSLELPAKSISLWVR